MKADQIVDECRRVRESLVKKHGGLDGWIDHLQEMDKARARRTKKKRSVKLAKATKDGTRQRTSRKVMSGGVKG